MNRTARQFYAAAGAALVLSACGGQVDDHSHKASAPLVSSQSAYDWAYAAEGQVSSSLKAIAVPLLQPGDVLVHAMKRTLKHTGHTVFRLAILNTITNELRKIDVDSASRPVDMASEDAANLTLRGTIYGTLTEDLASHLSTISTDSAMVDVQIWYKAPPPPPRPQPSAALAADLAARRASHALSLATARAPLLTRIKSLGASVRSQAEHAPFIEAAVSKAVIVNHLKNDGAILRIARSLRYEKSEPLGWDSSIDMHLYDFHSGGYYGSNIKWGIIEACRECGIWFGNSHFTFPSVIKKKPYLTCSTAADCPIERQGWPRYCNSGQCVGAHPTYVTGMFGGYWPYYWPYSYGARLATVVHANDANATHGELLDWLAGQGVHIVNESWSGVSTDWWAHDYFARNSNMVILRSSGNDPSAEVNCKSFNILCVGGHDTNGSAGYWGDDYIYTYGTDGSSYINLADCNGGSPGYGCDREQPDVVGHGSDNFWGGVATTTPDASDPDGWTRTTPLGTPMQGTSLSAPAVGALVALLHNRSPYGFPLNPELTRAVLMVSAKHDVNTPEPGKTYSDHRAPDERDGAGVPDGTRTLEILSNSTYDVFNLTPASFDANHYKTLATFYVPQGSTIRFAIAWSTCPTSYGYGCPPPPQWCFQPPGGLPGVSVDFDLELWDPSGTPRFWANSYDGTQEIGEVPQAAPAGNWTLRLKYWGTWNACNGQQQEYLGFAYRVGY